MNNNAKYFILDDDGTLKPIDPATIQASIPYQQHITPESPKHNKKMILGQINGNDVLLTSGINGDDFAIYRMPSKVNTKGGIVSSIGDDPIALSIAGVCLLVITGLITWFFMSILSGGNAKTAQQSQPYQPQPYTVTTEKCKPSGFLWLGETCNTVKETGYR